MIVIAMLVVGGIVSIIVAITFAVPEMKKRLNATPGTSKVGQAVKDRLASAKADSDILVQEAQTRLKLAEAETSISMAEGQKEVVEFKRKQVRKATEEGATELPNLKELEPPKKVSGEVQGYQASPPFP